MTVITDLASLETGSSVPSGAVFILGHFDGVHLGHRALFLEAGRMAESIGPGTPRAVWTLTGLDKGGALSDEGEKLRLFRRFGAGWAVSDEFREIRSMPGEDFFRERILSFSPAGVVCGYNFTFGRGASCGAEDLGRMAREAGIACSVVPAVEAGGVPVSSTEIRRLLTAGDMEGAAALTGRPWAVSGTVRHGHEIGRTIGFPTVNLRLSEGRLSPPHGVYAAAVRWESDGKPMLSGGVANLGSRPTVNGDRDDVTLETHLFASPGELYGRDVTVWLLRFLRPERKYGSVELLREAIARDEAEARRVTEALWSRYEDEFLL